MTSSLSQLSNEELWKLFPIILSEHKPEWKDLYVSEKKLLQQTVGEDIIRINHIGSTAVPGLIAKPTIDILLEIKKGTNLMQLISTIEGIGYIYSEQPNNPAPHMMFMKGYTPEGFKGQVYHLHVRYQGDWDEPCFCKYLQTHPETAQQYGKLKIKLEKQYKHNRDGYTQAKGAFIKKITKRARSKSRILQEKRTIELMIRLYCRKKEKNTELCPSCRELLEYAHARLNHCPFGEEKTACKHCSVHCYKPEMRKRVREVMRYSGPRMLLYAPKEAILHLLKK